MKVNTIVPSSSLWARWMALMKSWHFSKYCYQSSIILYYALTRIWNQLENLVHRLFTFQWKFINFTFHWTETRFSLVFHWIPFRSLWDQRNDECNTCNLHSPELSPRYECVHEIQFQYRFRYIFCCRRVYKTCNSDKTHAQNNVMFSVITKIYPSQFSVIRHAVCDIRNDWLCSSCEITSIHFVSSVNHGIQCTFIVIDSKSIHNYIGPESEIIHSSS